MMISPVCRFEPSLRGSFGSECGFLERPWAQLCMHMHALSNISEFELLHRAIEPLKTLEYSPANVGQKAFAAVGCSERLARVRPEAISQSPSDIGTSNFRNRGRRLNQGVCGNTRSDDTREKSRS